MLYISVIDVGDIAGVEGIMVSNRRGDALVGIGKLIGEPGTRDIERMMISNRWGDALVHFGKLISI